jgi:hypothetical protein
LKQTFTSAPLLTYADLSKPFILEADASDFALENVLSQGKEDRRVNPIAFHSPKFKAVKINYKVHDKEILSIVVSLEQWCHLLEDSYHQITLVYNEHKNLMYFQNARVLNCRQAR